MDLKALRRRLGTSALSFASEDRLKRLLGLEKGAVTPLGILNDEARAVEVLFDRDLAGLPALGVHPNRNTATVFLPLADLESLIRSHGNAVRSWTSEPRTVPFSAFAKASRAVRNRNASNGVWVLFLSSLSRGFLL